MLWLTRIRHATETHKLQSAGCIVCVNTLIVGTSPFHIVRIQHRAVAAGLHATRAVPRHMPAFLRLEPLVTV